MEIYVLVILCVMQLILIRICSEYIKEFFEESTDSEDNSWGIFFILIAIANALAVVFQSVVITFKNQ